MTTPLITDPSFYLDVDGTPIPGASWDCENLFELLNTGTTWGESTRLPGQTGRRANPTGIDETTVTLELVINGARDVEGTVQSNQFTGLFANVKYLRDHVADPNGSTRTGTLHLPDSTTRTATLQFPDGLQVAWNGPVAFRATLDLRITSGHFA